jgi:hypothetical protein
MVYNAGRVFTYVFMGVVVGVLGKIIQWGGIQGKISIAAGALIIVLVLVPRIQSIFLPSVSIGVLRLKALFSSQLRKKSAASSLLTGVLNGFLPCGLVYAALTIALVQVTPFQGAGVMALFGLGTVPAMVAAGYSWSTLRKHIPWSFQRIQTIMLIVVAALMLWRGISAETHLLHHHEPGVICTE